MKWIDQQFLANKGHYIFRSFLAAAGMLVILALITGLTNAAVIASLGASCFIVFALPHIRASHPRFLIGGYVVGILVGSLCYWLRCITPLPEELGLIANVPQIVFGAAAVGLAMFVMVVTDSEHPPAAGLALGFVMLSEWRWLAPLAVLAGIAVLCVVKTLLKPVLRNLL